MSHARVLGDPTEEDVRITRGSTPDLTGLITDGEGDPFDLSSVSDVRFLIKPKRTSDDVDAIADLSVTGGEITITNAPGGEILIDLPPAATDTPATYWHRGDVELTSGQWVSWRFGSWQVLDA